MKAKLLIALALGAAAASCAAPAQTDEAAVQTSSEALTTQECATQRDTCFNNNPFFGFFTCPIQYTQCLVTASNGIPAQVTSAIQDTAACQMAERTCLRSATTDDARLSCVRTEARCVSDVVQAHLPTIVTGTAQCIDDSVTCVAAAKSAEDVAACTRTLESCALDQAAAALPPAVATVVRDTSDCITALNTCTAAASSAGELAACRQDEVRCVATALGVTPPDPVDQAIQCAESAADCALDATSEAGVRECAADLVSCNAMITRPDQPLTCDQQWTQCLVRNPFGFLQCAVALNTCRARN